MIGDVAGEAAGVVSCDPKASASPFLLRVDCGRRGERRDEGDVMDEVD